MYIIPNGHHLDLDIEKKLTGNWARFQKAYYRSIRILNASEGVVRPLKQAEEGKDARELY